MIPIKLDLALKGEVPPKQLGRLIDTLNDLISPLSQTFGLVGDGIDIARSWLDLQKEAVKLKVAQRAIERMVFEKSKILDAPIKSISKILDACCLENPEDDEMIERWSNLLCSASVEKDFRICFIGILDALSASQARLFDGYAEEYLAAHQSEDEGKGELARADKTSIKKKLNDLFRIKAFDDNNEALHQEISDAIEERGCVSIIASYYSDFSEVFSLDYLGEGNADYENLKIDIEILISLGLIVMEDVSMVSGTFVIDISYLRITDLGVAFFRAVDPKPSRSLLAS